MKGRDAGGAWTRSITTGVAILLMAAPLGAQQVTWRGQVRPRYEYRDPTAAGIDEFTSMRVRAGLEAALDPQVSVYVELQDVRLWGEETNTLTDYGADNLDLHQGYLRFHGERLDWLTTTVGRQETNLGGQRLVGAVGWAQQGRSFDGVRVDAAGKASVSVIAYKLAEETAAAVTDDADLFGAYAVLSDVGPGSLDLYWLHDRIDGAMETRQHSLGARYAFTGALSGRLEATVQTGTRAGTDVSAYMVGARLGGTFADGRAGVTLWYDHLSGDSDPADGETGVFSTLYATGHKFFGFADLFTNIPAHTGGLGLRDAALKVELRPTAATRAAADLHSFRTTEKGTLSGTHLGEELDVTVTRRYTEHLAVTTGLSYILQDDPFAELGRLSENMTWGYVMLDVTF